VSVDIGNGTHLANNNRSEHRLITRTEASEKSKATPVLLYFSQTSASNIKVRKPARVTSCPLRRAGRCKRHPQQETLSFACVQNKEETSSAGVIIRSCPEASTAIRLESNTAAVLSSRCRAASQYLRLCGTHSAGSRSINLKAGRTSRFLHLLSAATHFYKFPNRSFCFDDNDLPFDFASVPTLSLSVFKERNDGGVHFAVPFSRELYGLPRKDNEFPSETNPAHAFVDIFRAAPFRGRIAKLLWVGKQKPTAAKACNYTAGRFRIEELLKNHSDLIEIPRIILSRVQQAKYKYILSLAGAGFTGSLPNMFMCGAVVLMQDLKVEMWFEKELVAWKHYIPVKPDLSDLVEKVRWLRMHPHESEVVARVGHEFAMKRFSDKALMQQLSEVIRILPDVKLSGEIICHLQNGVWGKAKNCDKNPCT